MNGVFERLPLWHRQSLPDPQRATPAELARHVQLLAESPIVTALLAAVDSLLLVLNSQRQIVAYNNRSLNGVPLAEVVGRRPGEALGCVNADGLGGCGSAPACQTCGSLGAILHSQQRGVPVEAECPMLTELGAGSAVEFNVRASPVSIGGHPFTVVSLRDISSEKRREALEQVFFHDMLNTVSGLRGWAIVLRRSERYDEHVVERLDYLSKELEREINDHRALLAAEKNALQPRRARERVAELLRDVELIFSAHAAARGRRLQVAPVPPDVEVYTDRSLLLRVLVNMVQNALEASPYGGEVRIFAAVEPGTGGEESGTSLRFNVRNEGVISPDHQAHIFRRSFSTKAVRGRGLGTYSMKLLGERYLGGEVSFASSPESGTVFSIRLPGSTFDRL
jgi:signal transduction histidine kinase